MSKALFAVFLVVIATAAAQNPTPSDQARQIQKEAMRSAPFKIIGWPTLTPAQPARIIPTLKKMENK